MVAESSPREFRRDSEQTPKDDADAVAEALHERLQLMPPDRAAGAEHISFCLSHVPSGVCVLELVKRLIKAARTTPLYVPAASTVLSVLATEREQETAVRHLLDAGAYCDCVGGNGRSALHMCDHDLAKRLLSIGVKFNRLDMAGRSPLSLACEENKLLKARYLLDARADVNGAVTDESTPTPLMFACAQGHEDIVSLLLEREANYVRLADGKCALEFAMQCKGTRGLHCMQHIQAKMSTTQTLESWSAEEKTKRPMRGPMTDEERQRVKYVDDIRSLDVYTDLRLKFEIERGEQGNINFIKEWIYGPGRDRIADDVPKVGTTSLLVVAAGAGNAYAGAGLDPPPPRLADER